MRDRYVWNVKIIETGEMKAIRYHAEDRLMSCGWRPGLSHLCCDAENELVYDPRNRIYECSEEVYARCAEQIEYITKIDDLGDRLIGNYGFDLMDVSKRRYGFGFYRGAKKVFDREYENLIVASNVFKLRKYFKEDAEAEARNLYKYGQKLPEEHKGFYLKPDDKYCELIEAIANSSSELLLELDWWQKLNIRRKYMAARGIISRENI